MIKIISWLLITLIAGIILYFAFFMFALGAFEKEYSKQDLIENYELKKNAINDLQVFLINNIPSNKSVNIEFEDDDILGNFNFKVNTNFEYNSDVK